MTTKDNIPVPNPPKAAQRGLGLLNPPGRTTGLSSITPPAPEEIGAPFDDTEFDESATQRMHVGLLRESPRAAEVSKTEPLLLQNIRLASKLANATINNVTRPQTGASEAPSPNTNALQSKPTTNTARAATAVRGLRANVARSQVRAANPLRPNRRPLAYDLDEDAVTKKIVVNRIVTVRPGNNDVHKPNTHIRVETREQNTGVSGVPVTTGEYRSPLASERPTDLSALGRAARAAEQRHTVLPSIRNGLRKVLSIFSPQQKNSGFGVGTPILEQSDAKHSLGANSYSAELYKEMRHALQAGADANKRNLPVPRYTYLVSRPPRIVLKGFLVRREKQTSLMLRGRAIHPICVRDVMIFADKKKVLYLSSAARNDAGCIEFSADIPLNGENSHILVVARHNEEVMGSQSLFVRKDDY